MRRIAPAAAAGLGVLLVFACTFSTETAVSPHRLVRPLPAGFVNSYNAEEQLTRGYVPEVSAFLASSGGKSLEGVRYDRLLGEVLLERGDFRGCVPHLERAFAGGGRSTERAEIAWLLSQAGYWSGDFASAARWARAAQREGKLVPEGWAVFLESPPPRPLYGGAAPGAGVTVPVDFGRPNLVRLPVRVNGRPPEEMVLDSGASVSLLTDSAAERLGVRFVPGATAAARGLHETETPMRLGWLDSVRIGDLTLTDIPVGVLPDGTLTFETAALGIFKLNGVLGAHLMKEFDWRLEYIEKRVFVRHLDPKAARGSKDQNLFFRRMKPMVRTSLNGQPWSLFLLDTGSEPSMVTRGGLRKTRLSEPEAAFPVTLEGIGNSRVSWGKISNVSLGVDAFMVRFKDIIVKEVGEGLEDGILGASFLANFDVEIRFGSMTLALENPVERKRREARAPAQEIPR